MLDDLGGASQKCALRETRGNGPPRRFRETRANTRLGSADATHGNVGALDAVATRARGARAQDNGERQADGGARMTDATAEPPIMPGAFPDATPCGVPSEPPPFPVKPCADGRAMSPGGGNAPFTIVVDTREQTPLMFAKCVPTIRAGLRTGDYSLAGFEDQFTVERKSLSDLVHTIIHDRARFERELERMRAFAFRRVVCTASIEVVRRGNYPHSAASPKAVLASIATFEVRYDVPFVFAGSSDEAARRIVGWAHYFTRERALREHERRLAGRTAGGSGAPTPPPGVGSEKRNANRCPTRKGAARGVIPTVVYGGVENCMGERRGGVRGCLKVSNGWREPKVNADKRKRGHGANT